MNTWRKLILYTAIVLLPAAIVGISNFSAFPDSWLAATLMLVVTVVVAGLFTWQSGQATDKIARYCIIADIIICAVLTANLAGHWVLAREVSAAKQGVEERHVEEDREEQRRAAETDRQLALKQAEIDLQKAQANTLHAERRRLAQLPVEQRRSALRAEPAKTPAITAALQPLSLAPAADAQSAIRNPQSAIRNPQSAIVRRLTPDEVREKWWWFLTALAIAECAVSVLAGAILCGVWEWDRNRDGIADHLQVGVPK